MEVLERLKSKTPLFFKKIRNIAGSVGAGCLGAAMFYPQLPQSFQEIIDPNLMKYIATAGIVAALVSQMTKTDTPQVNG